MGGNESAVASFAERESPKKNLYQIQVLYRTSDTRSRLLRILGCFAADGYRGRPVQSFKIRKQTNGDIKMGPTKERINQPHDVRVRT